MKHYGTDDELVTDEYVFFWNGICSQWYTSPFEEDGIKYNTAEQYMMAQKALVFKDTEIFKQIMKATSPREQKALGRKIKNFSDEVWDKHKIDVVTQGTYLKFSQDRTIKEWLMSFGTREFVEASPYDKVWGIGLNKEDERALNKETWEGENLLGVCLNKVRDRFLDDAN